MLSNTIRVGRESEILSGFYAVDGIDRSGQKYAFGFPVIGKQAGFTGLKIAGYQAHDRSLSVADQQEEKRDKGQGHRNAIFTKSLSSRRIYPVRDFIRLFLFDPHLFRPLLVHPHRFQRNRWLNRCCAQPSQPGGQCWLRPCVIDELAIFVQTGRITQWLPAASRRRYALSATKNKKNRAKKAGNKAHFWPVGNGMIVGGKAIFPDRDVIFFQLYFDYYANNVNQPAWQDTLTRHKPLHWPCGGDDAMTSYGECNPGLMTCTEESFGARWPETSGSRGNIPGDHPCFFNSTYFFGKENEYDFVVFRRSRFGLWNIKLLTALLLLFLLIAGLETFTGINGYVSIGNLSASELLSGLIIVLTMMVMALLVLCASIK